MHTVLLLPRLPALVQEHAALRGQLAAQQLELIRLRETLRTAAHTAALKQEALPGGVTASILVPPLLPTQHLITLDRGARTGLVLDAILIDAKGLVGRVIEVSSTTGVAMLLTDPNSRVACRIERSREVGLLTGSGELLCRFIYLDVEADVLVGDQVVTAGLGGVFPKGLPVGMVVKVIGHAHASPEVWVKPAVKLRQLEEVLCVSPAAEQSTQ